MKPPFHLLLGALISTTMHAAELHVTVTGKDSNPGTLEAPLRTIQAAADMAQAGDVITVHEGTYRERVNPPRGGGSDAERIIYQAAPGAKVEIKGSEVVTGWKREKGDVWKVTLPASFFGDFNPFADEIRGDWFNGQGRKHHTGAVYLNGEWLTEAASLDDLLLPEGEYPGWLVPAAGGFLMNIAWIEAAAKTPAAEFAEADGEIKSTISSEGGECIGWIADGNSALYKAVDFGNASEEIRIRVASPASGGRIEIRLDKSDGELLGTAEFKPTGDWQKWTTATAEIPPTSGKKDIRLVFRRPPLDHAAIQASLKARHIGALWFAEVAADGSTTVWAQFPGADPNKELVEVNVRQSVFYPDQPGRDFITVRGFTMAHAATNWAPPTAEQVGLIGTHWSKGWIIENNRISHSVCTGITLGKHGDKHDNTSADTAEGYVETIKRAQAFRIPWTKERIGHHLVRDNTIAHCEQSGIVGSMGGAFSTIEGNHIHDINIRRMLAGAEQAGIKLHAPIDTVIRRNRIHRVAAFGGGIWLDWMTQGTRVTGNLLYENSKDLFLEVNHGPYLVDHNILLSGISIWDWSQGGAFAHNLIGGSIQPLVDGSRETPYHPPHSTAMAGLSNIKGGDTRYYNNHFARGPHGGGLAAYGQPALPLHTGGNLYDPGTSPPPAEKDAANHPVESKPSIIDEAGAVWLQFTLDTSAATAKTRLVTTELLGRAVISNLPFVHPDGSPVTLDHDFAGGKRDAAHPSPGPFEKTAGGENRFKVW
jgi:alpha-L-arabinofuranosidase